MELFYLDGLPPHYGKGSVVRFLIEDGDIGKQHIGKIVLHGGLAIIEVPDGWAARLVRALDGRQVETRHIRAWHKSNGREHPTFAQLRRWLTLEARAEQQRHRPNRDQAAETSLTRLVLRGEDVGLGGRTLHQFSPRNEQASLPWSRLTVGSPVLLSAEGETAAHSWRGLISRLSRQQVEVAFNQPPDLTDSTTFRLDLASDEITRQRMERALTRVEAATANRTAVLRQIILGDAPATYQTNQTFSQFNDLTAHLNPSQQAAVQHALCANDLALIHGPPGTGKTTTVTALIATAVANQQRVLACAPSNLAVDNLVEKLAEFGLPLVRLGHPLRVLPEIQQFTLDMLVEQHDDYRQAKKLRKEAFGLHHQANKFRRARPEPGSKRALRQEAGEMLTEARQLEANAVERVLDGAAVVLATLTGIDSAILGQRHFDLCVIDEAGQAVAPATWIPVPRSQKLVLAGDHQQLPPTILSRQAQKEGFGVSLLEQLMERDGRDLSRRLDVQYRMHEQIMGFSSAEFYEGSLLADTAVAHHLLSDFTQVAADDFTETAVTFIDTAGANFDEEKVGDSTRNPQEAQLASQKAQQLLAAGVPAAEIAIITPYSAQVQLLRDLVDPQIEIGSVDAFQGREKEAIIMSLVRSNLEGTVGFLAETRRMNVALTRARRKLIVIGDSATITADDFYGRFLSYLDTINAYHSVWEEATFY